MTDQETAADVAAILKGYKKCYDCHEYVPPKHWYGASIDRVNGICGKCLLKGPPLEEYRG